MDARCRQVREEVTRDIDCDAHGYSDAMRAYREYLTRGVCESETFAHAFAIYEDPIQKEIVEALIFSGADPVDVETVFDLPQDVYEAYAHMFFDISGFRSKLDKISYVERYDDEFGKGLKLRALNMGPTYVYFMFGNTIPKTDAQRELVKRMFMTSAYKAMNINYASSDSKASKAAVQHAQLMLKSYECIEKLMDDGGDDAASLIHVVTKRELELNKSHASPVSPEDII